MGIISDLKLGMTLKKLTDLFVEANRYSSIGSEDIGSTMKYQKLTAKLRAYRPFKVEMELLNNMMITAKSGNEERGKAQEDLRAALVADGLAVGDI
ncbi:MULTISPECIES: hypothetical protein [Halomonadaceae]|uniref:hypothetical protein n=1 Tax=Halomonadaceae TaxID=28256 RepID=UPI001582C27B|nr:MULTISPECIES: hypothetical protein [Halomonas]MDI4638349.1 hypothetical protein [Halomonas sp. BMC7]NUJ59337.1 hypothetical protein [Halomonas taeanensis]